MNEPLEESYFNWLLEQAGLENSVKLGQILFAKEFIWLIANDDNRMQDGLDLRREFLNLEDHESVDQEWLDLGCSMLEMLIGLARRLAFDTQNHPHIWIRRLLENLRIGLLDVNYRSRQDEEYVEDILDRLIWRNYDYNGQGGLFPLNHPDSDQSKVEIWYQMNAYLLERL